MNKKIKRLPLLLAILCTAQMLSCAQSQEDDTPAQNDVTEETAPAESVTEETIDPMLLDDLPDVSLDGYTFRILSCYFVDHQLANFMMFEEMTGDVLNDELFKSTIAVEERFDADICYIEEAGYEAVQKQVITSVNAGTDDFDIQAGNDIPTAALVTQGMFYNMYNVEQFNFEKPWWPSNILPQLEVANRLYVGSSYLTYSGLHWTRTLIANKDRFEENQIEIPYDEVFSGTWYYDTMLNMVRDSARDLDGNGTMDDTDFYGFSLGGNTSYCIQDSFGISFYEKTDEGITVACDQERTDYFIEKMRELICDANICYKGGGTENDFSKKMFLEDKALLSLSMLGTAYDHFRGTEIRYCILPFPKFDELQENYINACTDFLWAIPTTAVNNIDAIGTIIEALSCLNYRNVIPVYYETAMKVKLSESPTDAAMFDIIKDTRTISFERPYSLPFADIVKTLVEDNSSIGFATYFARMSKAAQKTVDAFYEAIAGLPE